MTTQPTEPDEGLVTEPDDEGTEPEVFEAEDSKESDEGAV